MSNQKKELKRDIKKDINKPKNQVIKPVPISEKSVIVEIIAMFLSTFVFWYLFSVIRHSSNWIILVCAIPYIALILAFNETDKHNTKPTIDKLALLNLLLALPAMIFGLKPLLIRLIKICIYIIEFVL